MKNDAIAYDLIGAVRETVREAARSVFDPGYLDAISSAHYIGIKPRRFESIAKEIPCHRFTPGGKRLYSRADLDEFMAKRRVAEDQEGR